MPSPYPASFDDELGIGRLEGDLSFTDPANLPGADATAIDGVTVTGVPGVGDLITATAATTATWQAPAAPPPALGSPVVRGPFTILFNDAGLNAGITFYTPAVGDLLLDAWLEMDVLFDGTTPTFDFGPGGTGLFNATSASLGLNGGVDSGADILHGGFPGNTGTGYNNSLMTAAANFAGGLAGYYTSYGRFLTATPLKVWVSQDGTQGGAAIGGTAGAARLYIVTATPVALP